MNFDDDASEDVDFDNDGKDGSERGVKMISNKQSVSVLKLVLSIGEQTCPKSYDDKSLCRRRLLLQTALILDYLIQSSTLKW